MMRTLQTEIHLPLNFPMPKCRWKATLSGNRIGLSQLAALNSSPQVHLAFQRILVRLFRQKMITCISCLAASSAVEHLLRMFQMMVIH